MINQRTGEVAVGKYPIWFLINDDSSNIRCLKRGSRFIAERPLLVGSSDRLTLKILQRSRDEQSVPIRELKALLGMATLIMPYSSMLLNGLRATGKEYLKDINRDVQ